MKKYICLFMTALMLTGCGEAVDPEKFQNNESSSQTEISEAVVQNKTENIQETTVSLSMNGFDYDLTQLNANMMYGQIFDMTFNSEQYMNKSIRVTGYFSYYKDGAGKEYFSVFIPDAAACCGQGIEFILDGDYTYPEDYPEIGEMITVTGIFSAYEEYGVTYCQLLNAEIVPVVLREDSQ